MGFQDSAISASHGTHQSDREGVLELSYSYGIENTSGGDQEPRGLRPVCLSVDNVQTTCKALCDAGYRINCNSEEETAHVLDPDGFWIKLVAHRSLGRIDDTATADYKGSKVHHTMIGVRDKNVSRKFYEQVFGMTWKYEQHSTQAGRDRFLLGCGKPHTSGPSVDISKPDVKCEGLLELLCIEDTKNKDGMKHHNGNLRPDDPGHICISVDDIHAACERLESLGVQWQKRLMDGPFRVAFIHDPDGNVSLLHVYLRT